MCVLLTDVLKFWWWPIVDDESELGNWAKNVSILALTPDRVRNDQINESAHVLYEISNESIMNVSQSDNESVE